MKTVAVPFLLMILGAYSLFGQNSPVRYTYDASGNRQLRTREINLSPMSGRSSNSAVSSHAEETRTEGVAAPEAYHDVLGERKVVIYPNPTQGLIRIEFRGYGEMKTARLLLYDVQGKLLRQANSVEPSSTLDLSSYPAGVYILQMIEGNAKSVWKIIKE